MRYFVTLLAALVAAPVARAAEEPLTLSAAVERALGRHPSISAARAGQDLARAGAAAARDAWIPRLSISETFTRSDNPVFVFGSLLEQGRFGQEHFDPAFLNDPDAIDNFRLGVNLQFPLFDQLRRVSRTKQSSLAVERSRLELESVTQGLRLEVIRRFVGVNVAAGALQVADEAIAMAEADLEQVRSRFEAGMAVESDLLAAEVQLAEMRQQQATAAGDLEVARAALRLTIGASTVEELQVAPVADRVHEMEPLDTLVATARERADLRARTLEQRQAALDVRMSRGSFLPRIDTFGSWGGSGESFSERDEDTTYGAVLSFDILSPGRNAAVRQARAAEKMAESRVRSAEMEVELDVTSSYHRFVAASRRLELARKAEQQASEAMRIIRDRYSEGLTTVTEVLRAETALVRARTTLLAARSDYHVGYADVLRSTGRLTDVSNLF